jgi:hypothetical protein
MQDYSTLNQSPLSALLGGGSSEPLIPESLMTLLIIGFVLINLLALAFFVFWFMGMIRRWKVQTAVLHMQKDIADIKQALVTQPTEAASSPVANEQAVQPASEPQTQTGNQFPPNQTGSPST